MNKIYNFLLVFFSIVWLGCNRVEYKDAVVLDEKESFAEFPLTDTLSGGTPVIIDSYGNLEFKIVDSIMIVSTAAEENSWKVFSLPSDSLVLEILDIGNAQNELSAPSFVSQVSFMKKGGDTYALINNNARQETLSVNLSESVASNRLVYATEEDHGLSQFRMLSYKSTDKEGSVFDIALDINPMECSVKRSLGKDGAGIYLKSVDRLNNYKVESPEYMGLLMPHIIMNPDRDRIVEIMNLYPQINIYSFSDTFVKTLCPEGKIGKFSEFYSRQMNDASIVYRSVVGYDSFFVVNHADRAGTELWFFDWNGKPLLNLKINSVVTCFDIDFINKLLYTLDFNKDEMIKYPLDDILSKVNSTDS